MKILYKTNLLAFIITLVLYLTIYFGLLFQILLGLIQIFSALSLFYYWKNISKSSKAKVLYYWVFVAVYFLLCITIENLYNDTIPYIIGLILLPLSIASYFLYTLKRINKELS